MPGSDLRLLALDGGGVRGLSTLMILRRLMATVDPVAPPKTQIIVSRGLDKDALLKDVDAPCKVFVCATSKETGDTPAATSAATTFFEPVAIGPFNEEFVDGALGANNPVYTLWSQAQDVRGDQLQAKLRCLVSVGTGVPSLNPVRDDVLGIWATLKELATEMEKTAQRFHRDKSNLDDEGRYYRFNVDRGLEDVALQESKKKKEIAAATRRYVESREYHGPYRTVFTLQGVPASDNFIERLCDTAELERSLLPHHRSHQKRRIFVLYGLGGIGKTQLAVNFARRHQTTFSSVFWLDGRTEDKLRHSLAGCASGIPEGQIPSRSRKPNVASKDDLDTVISDVLAWLARPDNVSWRLIFDNVDQDYQQDRGTGVYDVRGICLAITDHC
ncbi:Patatin family protein [Pleurostoma richardsiae]|uniref:Patatin family protein n=1 Tax=Pleurostoma richardsiae TaxID=41990 RepID=A0AA38RJQ2_9PEZI|nr:Patatin family protein [Pleurostoma richardsiae]